MEDKAPDKAPEGKEKSAVSGKAIEIPTPKAEAKKAVQPTKDSPAKGDKPTPGKGKKGRDKLSQSGKVEPKAPTPEKSPAEPPKDEPKEPPCPIDLGKLVWLKLSEAHPFHAFCLIRSRYGKILLCRSWPSPSMQRAARTPSRFSGNKNVECPFCRILKSYKDTPLLEQHNVRVIS